MTALSSAPPPPTARTLARRLLLSGHPRARRWLLRGLVALFALGMLLALAAVLVLQNLDAPWLKRRLRALVQEQTGVQLDYEAVRWQGLSQLTLEGLVVSSPAALQKHAPELLRVARLHASWSAASLLHAALHELRLEQVQLTVVIDEHGRTSFDALSPEAAGPAAREPGTPLSQQAASLLDGGLPLRALQASQLTASLLQTRADVLVERDTLAGLALALAVGEVQQRVQLHAALGTGQAPLALAFRRQRPGQRDDTAALRMALDADATSADARAALELHVVRQDLVPALALDTLTRLRVQARFEPKLQRTVLALTQLELADASVRAEGALLLPDQGAPLLQHAEGKLDPQKLVRLGSAWSLPLTLAHGALSFRIDNLALDRPATGAAVALEGELTGASWRLVEGSVELAQAHLSLHARPGDRELAFEGGLRLEGLALSSSQPVRADGVVLELSGTQSERGTLDGQAKLAIDRLAARGPSAVLMRALKLDLQVHGLSTPLSETELPRGELGVRGQLRSLETSGALALLAEDTALDFHMPAASGPTRALALDLDSKRVLLTSADQRVLLDSALQLKLSLADLLADLQQPERSLGRAQLTLEAAALRAELTATRREGTLDYELAASAPGLEGLRPFLSADMLSRAPWARMAAELKSSGRVERLGSALPRLRQHSALRIGEPAFDQSRARAIELLLDSNGNLQRHNVHAELSVHGLQIDGTTLGDDHLSLALALDRTVPSLQVELKSDRLSDSQLLARLRFERKTEALHYELRGHLAKLSALSDLLTPHRALAGFDLKELELALSAEGTLTGVVRSIDARGVRLSPALLATAGGHGNFEVHGKNMRWAEGENGVSIPAAHWRSRLRGEGDRRSLDSELSTEQLDGNFGALQIAATGIVDRTQVVLSGGLAGTLEHAQQITVRTLKQNLVPGYVVGNLTADLAASRTGDGLIKLTKLRIENLAGGTTLALSGGAELTRDEHRLSLRSKLEQDLSRFSNRRDVIDGSGRLSMEVTLSSPDFRIFHTAAKLQLAGASLRLPQQKIALESMDGELPIVSDFIVDRDGLEVLGGAHVNPYTAQRFADQHPLLGYRSFISIASVRTPYVSLSPFAANLEVARNTVSLSQLEMGVRGGTITGSSIIEYNGLDSVVHANVRASGVNSSHGEPFDGNAALTIGVRERTVEGRADILRIGRRHLTDLLDLQDPLRTDPAIKQIRSALRFGYPDRVRLSFQHGFASAGVEFGGLARLLTVKDVRGIPLGPLMERVMTSIQPVEAEP